MAKTSNLTIPAVSYRSAFGISIVFHLLIFLVLAHLFNPIESPRTSEILLAIDFVSFPGEEDQQVSDPTQPESINQSFQNNDFVNPALLSQNTKDEFFEEDIKSQKSDQFEESDNQVNHSFDLAEGMEKSEFSQSYLVSGFMPSDLKLPRFDIAEPKLVPPKVPISERQERILEKEITKFTEKLNQRLYSDTTIFIEDKGQVFNLEIRHKSAKSTTDLDELIFEITTEKNGETLATQVRMRRLAFSNFAQLVDYWDPLVAVHDDEFEGRFHTNYAFSISRSKGIGPKFRGKVTTAAVEVNKRGDFPILDETSIFLGGIETGVKQIRLPKTFSLFSEHSKLPGNQVHHITEDTWLIFNHDGTYTWRTTSLSAQNNLKKITAESFFIIGDKGTKIHVKGTIKGKVLIYSAGDIIIDGNLFYARPPDKFPNSDDYLGLVSEKSIEIAHPKITGSGDLHVFAAIYAKQWFRIPNRYGTEESTLHIYGSLSAGSLTATEPRYATRIRFDKRLETQRPPNFPVTENYEVIEWDKVWTINKN